MEQDPKQKGTWTQKDTAKVHAGLLPHEAGGWQMDQSMGTSGRLAGEHRGWCVGGWTQRVVGPLSEKTEKTGRFC